MNESTETDTKEAQLQRQKEAIGEMRSVHHSLQKKEPKTGSSEKENCSSPEIIPGDDLRDAGSADSTDSAGSPNPTPNPEETSADFNSAELTDTKEDENEKPNVITDTVTAVKEKTELDDEVISNGGNSIGTVEYADEKPTIENPVDEESDTSRTLEMSAENENVMKKTTEKGAPVPEAQITHNTYTLPSVLKNQNQKKQEEENDDDSEIFALEDCNDCQTIKRDTKQKTKVCILM